MSVSCCLSKKFKTETETTIVTKIDTIIKFVPDTTVKIKTVEIHDTAFIENDVAEARSFFDVKTQKIVLSLKGKIVDVPVVVDQVITTKENKQSIEKKPIFTNYLIAFIIGALLVIIAFTIALIKIKLKL